VLHVDLDQFIAAVEMLRHPEIRGKPVVVGGEGDPDKRGVVSTANYEAREYGIRSGMPLRTAYRRCPQAVFLPLENPLYLAASAQVMDTLRRFPAVVQVMGWDEAFVAVDRDDPEAMANEIQRAVRERTALWCSVGVGDNKLRAKLATGFAKPAGVFTLTRENWKDVMGGLPADALWGVGAKTARKLLALGIPTVARLADADLEELVRSFGPSIGPWLIRLARGEDGRAPFGQGPGQGADLPGGHRGRRGDPPGAEQARPRAGPGLGGGRTPGGADRGEGALLALLHHLAQRAAGRSNPRRLGDGTNGAGRPGSIRAGSARPTPGRQGRARAALTRRQLSRPDP